MRFLRTTWFATGAAVTLVIASGTAAASGGLPVLLGHGNPAHATTGLADSHGTPLSLIAKKGSAPLKVNSSVKVKGLNADLLDGKDSSGFLPAAGTAANSALLGGQPAAAFLPANGTAVAAITAANATNATTAATATNAGMLGGLPPSAYVDGIYQLSRGTSVSVSSVSDTLAVPAGTYLVSLYADLGNSTTTAENDYCRELGTDPSGIAGYADIYLPADTGGHEVFVSGSASVIMTLAAPGNIGLSCAPYGGSAGSAKVAIRTLTATPLSLVNGAAPSVRQRLAAGTDSLRR